MRGPTPDEATEFLAAADFVWHQRWELAPGVETPGVHDIGALWRAARLPDRFDGLTVLDVGTCNGAVAFAADAAGAARVVAVDILPPGWFGFDRTAAFLGSRAEFVQASLYELPDLLDDAFDVVVCWGVLYHLRHPLLGLDALRRLTRGVCSLETEVCDWEVRAPEPVLRFYRRAELNADGSNWFSPNVSALQDLCASAGFAARPDGTVLFPEAGAARRALLTLDPVEGEPEYVGVSYGCERPLRVRRIDDGG